MAEKRPSLKRFYENNNMEEYLKHFPNNVGSSGYDPWGFNIEGVKRMLPISKFLYEKYFRVEAFGLENIPKEGRCLIIANHSGQLPLDGMLIGHALLTNPHGARAPKAMIERFLPSVPFVGNMLNALGAVIGDPVNCERMLNMEEAIIVFPEGVRGAGKIFKHRYQLQRFGNGFMHLAMKHNAPIIPVGVVGCEESIVSVADIKPLAKFLGIPYAPLVFPMVLPTKVYLHFGEPMDFTPKNKEFKETEISANTAKVTETIKGLIELGLAKRKAIFE
ncbi:MAG: acyltransferase family protein [Chitinophagales bacterium]|nr:acyltransferase family protein [Chitinophagales bacterium]